MRTCTWLLPYTIGFCLLLPAISSCDTTIKTDEAVVRDAVAKNIAPAVPQQVFQVDTAKSQVTWVGAKLTGRHNGLFGIRGGELHMNRQQVTGGRIVLDMAALHCDDKTLDAANNQKLTTHLRSADFFDVARYPTAVFELTGIASFDSTAQKPDAARYSELRIHNPTHRITGNLTIKGKTKSITFPARVTQQEGTLTAKANFNLDRTKWDLVYRSDQSLGDQTIYPEVNIGLNIVARQQEQ